MSFTTNQSQQISLFDATANLTDRRKRLLEKSWAKYFAENIFPEIDEKPFSVLYSDRPSRHNTPVNVIIGALILKEIFGLTDEEIVETLPFDIRYQYALHITSFEKQPLVCCKSKMENIADPIWRKMQELGSLSHCLSM